MKQLLIIVFATAMCLVKPAFGNDFEGVWILVKGEYINHNNKLVDYSELNLKSQKIIHGNHFSFVTMTGDKFWSSGAGLFEFDDNEYRETPTLNSFSSPKDKQYVFQYKIVDNKWYNSRYENGKRVEFEVWQRL